MQKKRTARPAAVFFLLFACSVLTFCAGGLSCLASGSVPSAAKESLASPEQETTPSSVSQNHTNTQKSSESDAADESGTEEGQTAPSADIPDDRQPEKYEIASGLITGLSQAYLDGLSEKGDWTVDLNIPEEVNGSAVTGIGENAFSPKSYPDYPSLTFRNLDLSRTRITAVGAEAFSGCSLLTGVLILPDTVTSIGENAFSGTGYSTVLLPDSLNSCSPSAFDADGPVLVFPDSAVFQRITQNGPEKAWNKAGYPLTLTLKGTDGSVLETREVLYSLPINYKRSQESWIRDSSWKLPEIAEEEGYTCGWTFSPDGPDTAYVTENSPVTGNTLYAVRDINPPQISFGKDIAADYNGKAHTLSVTAGHPLYQPSDQAQEGDVLFYYIWTWKEGELEKKEEGYDLSHLSFTQPADTSVTVTVQAEVKGSPEAFFESSHTFKVTINEKESSLPYRIHASVTSGHGTVEPQGQLSVSPEDDIRFAFTPDPGFQLDQVLLDGEDVTSQVQALSYTLKPAAAADPEASHTLTVSYREMDVPGLRSLFQSLPALREGASCSEETRAAYLNAWIQYQTLARKDGITLPSGILNPYFASLMHLPGIRVHADSVSSLSVSGTHALLEHLSLEDAEGLLKGTITEIYFSIKIQDAVPEKAEEKALLALQEGSSLADSLLLSAEKTIIKNDGTQDRQSLTELSRPLTLRFSLSSAGEPAEGYERSFSIGSVLRTGKDSPSAILLKTVDGGETEITVNASEFSSLFAVLIRDSKIQEEPSQTESPSEPESPSETESSSEPQKPSETESSSEPEKPAESESPSESQKPSESESTSQTSSSESENPSDGNSQENSRPQESSSSGQGSSDSGNGSHEGGSSTTYVPDYEKDFWEEVRTLVKNAKAGETINVNAVTYDRMPENVMAALRENSRVALIVRWDGGDPVIIPAQTALAREEGRVYYPLSYLSAFYKTVNAALTQPAPSANNAPQLTAPVQPSPDYTPTPDHMGMESENASSSASRTEDGDNIKRPSASSENQSAAAEESETAAEPEGSMTPESSQAQEKENPSEGSTGLTTAQVTKAEENSTLFVILAVSAVMLVLVIILIIILLTLKRR